MTDRTRQIAIAIVALAVLAMLWLTGNDQHGTADDGQAGVMAPAQPASAVRGIPRDGTLDPISIDPNRSADPLPEYQADAILRDYQDHPERAEQRYRGAYFIVDGVASGIRRDGDKQVYLDIRTTQAERPVRANLLPRQICGPAGRVCDVEARATMVRRGQKVAVECTGGGLVDGTPRLDGCLLRGGAN